MEIVASTAMLGVVMTATMTSIAASRTRATSEMARFQAESLANDLLTEILALPACDPDNGPSSTLGPESGESDGDVRTNWDDVDDYSNLSESPPRTKDGNEIEGFNLWTRQTIVERIKSHDWTEDASQYDHVYRVTVTVSRNGAVIANSIGYRNGDQSTNSPLQGP